MAKAMAISNWATLRESWKTIATEGELGLAHGPTESSRPREAEVEGGPESLRPHFAASAADSDDEGPRVHRFAAFDHLQRLVAAFDHHHHHHRHPHDAKDDGLHEAEGGGWRRPSAGASHPVHVHTPPLNTTTRQEHVTTPPLEEASSGSSTTESLFFRRNSASASSASASPPSASPPASSPAFLLSVHHGDPTAPNSARPAEAEAEPGPDAAPREAAEGDGDTERGPAAPAAPAAPPPAQGAGRPASFSETLHGLLDTIDRHTGRRPRSTSKFGRLHNLPLGPPAAARRSSERLPPQRPASLGAAPALRPRGGSVPRRPSLFLAPPPLQPAGLLQGAAGAEGDVEFACNQRVRMRMGDRPTFLRLALASDAPVVLRVCPAGGAALHASLEPFPDRSRLGEPLLLRQASSQAEGIESFAVVPVADARPAARPCSAAPARGRPPSRNSDRPGPACDCDARPAGPRYLYVAVTGCIGCVCAVRAVAHPHAPLEVGRPHAGALPAPPPAPPGRSEPPRALYFSLPLPRMRPSHSLTLAFRGPPALAAYASVHNPYPEAESCAAASVAGERRVEVPVDLHDVLHPDPAARLYVAVARRPAPADDWANPHEPPSPEDAEGAFTVAVAVDRSVKLKETTTYLAKSMFGHVVAAHAAAERRLREADGGASPDEEEAEAPPAARAASAAAARRSAGPARHASASPASRPATGAAHRRHASVKPRQPLKGALFC